MVKKVKAVSKPKTEVWISKELYGEAPEKYHFILANGDKLKDLKDLNKALEKMPEDIFRHHVNEMKNDFSTWVKDVLKEDNLANDLKRFNSRMEEELTLQRHINQKMEKLIKKLSAK